MALNPPMYDARVPMAKQNEFFLLQRDGLKFEVETAGLPKLKSGSGLLFLTTDRLIFVCTPEVKLSGGGTFTSFELPLKELRAEKFNQPIFGANYLSGTVRPTPGMGLTSDAIFSLTFNRGGAGTFLHLFFRAMADARTTPADNVMTLGSIILSGSLRDVAVVDPSDPTTVYVTQPNFPVAKAELIEPK